MSSEVPLPGLVLPEIFGLGGSRAPNCSPQPRFLVRLVRRKDSSVIWKETIPYRRVLWKEMMRDPIAERWTLSAVFCRRREQFPPSVS